MNTKSITTQWTSAKKTNFSTKKKGVFCSHRRMGRGRESTEHNKAPEPNRLKNIWSDFVRLSITFLLHSHLQLRYSYCYHRWPLTPVSLDFLAHLNLYSISDHVLFDPSRGLFPFRFPTLCHPSHRALFACPKHRVLCLFTGLITGTDPIYSYSSSLNSVRLPLYMPIGPDIKLRI